MRITLVGWGIETQSAYRYFGEQHQYLIVSEEDREDLPKESPNIKLRVLSEKRPIGLTGNVTDLSYLQDLTDGADLIIYTPTARKNLEKIYSQNDPFWQTATTTLEYFFENTPSKNIIGITGTKGKGTTTTLIAKMLQEAGLTTQVGGNIGIPVLDLLKDLQPEDWVVLELSSFQLYKFPYSPHIAVNLMIVPEHIDEWHKTMEDYVSSKANIFAHQKPEDIAIYYPENEYSKVNATKSPGQKIPYLQAPGAEVVEGEIQIGGQKIVAINKVGLKGQHNLQNICAALSAVWQVQQNPSAYRKVIQEFNGLEHRLQLVGKIADVNYYDDSFGTTPDTAIVALDAFSQNKVLIVGGHDKGNDYGPLAERLVKDDLRKVIFIGTTGQKILDLAQKAGFKTEKAIIREDGNSWKMAEIVERAQQAAQSGDVVLLSTGSASFGLFKDYKDRGNQFIKEVQKLKTKAI